MWFSNRASGNDCITCNLEHVVKVRRHAASNKCCVLIINSHGSHFLSCCSVYVGKVFCVNYFSVLCSYLKGARCALYSLIISYLDSARVALHDLQSQSSPAGLNNQILNIKSYKLFKESSFYKRNSYILLLAMILFMGSIRKMMEENCLEIRNLIIMWILFSALKRSHEHPNMQISLLLLSF